MKTGAGVPCPYEHDESGIPRGLEAEASHLRIRCYRAVESGAAQALGE